MKIPLQMPLINPFDESKFIQIEDTTGSDKKERDMTVIDGLIQSIRFESEMMQSAGKGEKVVTEKRMERWDLLKKVRELNRKKEDIGTFDSKETEHLVEYIQNNFRLDLDLMGQLVDILNDKCPRAEEELKRLGSNTKKTK